MNVMVNGLPGKMSTEVARRIIKDSYLRLIPFSLTGPEIKESIVRIGEQDIQLIKPNSRKEFLKKLKVEPFISIDYTHPNAVNENGNFYCEHDLPFVMGTTGGNRDDLIKRVNNSNISAVIAPNMAKQIVALQSVVESMAFLEEISLSNHRLEVWESHQKGKADTSGTAKTMIRYFNSMGIPYSEQGIEINSLDEIDSITKQGKIAMIRRPELQRELGVPEKFLGGHGWHNYKIEYTGNLTNQNIHLDMLAISLLNNFFDINNPIFRGYSFESHSNGFFKVTATSPDKNILFEIKMGNEPKTLLEITHNVNGRGIYVDGTLDAVKFLDERISNGKGGIVYDMVDVLEGTLSQQSL